MIGLTFALHWLIWIEVSRDVSFRRFPLLALARDQLLEGVFLGLVASLPALVEGFARRRRPTLGRDAVAATAALVAATLGLLVSTRGRGRLEPVFERRSRRGLVGHGPHPPSAHDRERPRCRLRDGRPPRRNGRELPQRRLDLEEGGSAGMGTSLPYWRFSTGRHHLTFSLRPDRDLALAESATVTEILDFSIHREFNVDVKQD
jgi:hypothetical protein